LEICGDEPALSKLTSMKPVTFLWECILYVKGKVAQHIVLSPKAGFQLYLLDMILPFG
jgi:hypothetical protein